MNGKRAKQLRRVARLATTRHEIEPKFPSGAGLVGRHAIGGQRHWPTGSYRRIYQDSKP